MRIKLNHVKKILNDNLSVTQSGLLITILLLTDDKPSLTLAKVKSEINMKEYREDLIYLHENNFIEWSGYNSAKNSNEKKEVNNDVVEAINFMNSVYGRNFRADSPYATKNLIERLKTYSLEDVKSVISNRWIEWKDDPVMEKHLNPTTIFRPSKFEKYFEEASRTKKGSSIVQADKVDLKPNQKIEVDMMDSFLDKEIYSIKTYDLDPKGKRITSAINLKVHGQDLKKMLKKQADRIKRGDYVEFEYIYQKI